MNLAVFEPLEYRSSMVAELPCCQKWVQTYTGRVLHPHDPSAKEFSVRDFARGLAREPRFNGQTVGARAYSVAQHSVLGADEVLHRMDATLDNLPWRDRGVATQTAMARRFYTIALAFVVHDGHEWIFHDLGRPVMKDPCMAGYVAARERFQRVVNTWVGLPENAHTWPAVREIDDAMLATEQRDLMVAPPQSWGLVAKPLHGVIVPTSAQRSARDWRSTLRELKRQVQMNGGVDTDPGVPWA